MSAMELDGDVAAHPPSSPVPMAPPISTPSEQPSPREEKRCELSDHAGLDRAEQASRARPIKKEKTEEVVNKDKQDKKKERERKKREREENKKMKKIRKQKKKEQRMKRKLEKEKEKAIARALILLRLPESVLDTEQKEDDNITSGLAVPGPAVSDTEQKDDGTLSNAAVSDVQQKGNRSAFNAAVSDAAVSDAAVSDALMSDAYASDTGSDDGRVQTPHFEGWSSPEPENDDDDNNVGQLSTPTPTPPPAPALKKNAGRYQDYFPHGYSSDESEGVADPDTDEFAARLLATQPLRIGKQPAATGPATTAGPAIAAGPSAAPQGGNNGNNNGTGAGTNTPNALVTDVPAAVPESVLHRQMAAYRERRRLRSAEFDIVMVVFKDEMDKFAERIDIQGQDMLYLIRPVGNLEERADFLEEQWVENN